MTEADRLAVNSAVDTQGLKLNYGNTPILRGIDLSLSKGQTLALLGPSGCGKTTLLRLVAGLLAPSMGRVVIDGEVVADAGAGMFVPPERRGLGMVFQDYALWPHLTIAGNVGFPLEMRRIGRAERDERVARALDRVGLGGFGARNPGELSGGQQQRVAIARAIVAEPSLVLFDEPLSNLDRELRETMISEIAQLMSGLGLTAIYVTHDQSEAFTLADQVAVMRNGTIAQLAAPDLLVGEPADPGVAEFLRLGAMTDVEYRGNAMWLGAGSIQLDMPAGLPAGVGGRMLVSPKAIRLSDTAGSAVVGTVIRTQFRGDTHAATVRVGTLDLQVVSDVRLRSGETIGLDIEPGRLRWFPAEA